jgi:hypothetical protein
MLKSQLTARSYGRLVIAVCEEIVNFVSKGSNLGKDWSTKGDLVAWRSGGRMIKVMSQTVAEKRW